MTAAYGADHPDPVLVTYLVVGEPTPPVEAAASLPVPDDERTIAIVDEHWGILAVGPDVTRWGRQPQDLVGEPALLYVHPDDLPDFVRTGDDVLSGRVEEAQLSYRAVDATGTWQPIVASVRAVTGSGGSRALAFLFADAVPAAARPEDEVASTMAWLRSRTGAPDRWSARVTTGLTSLTAREREVLVPIVEGLRVPTVARRLGVAPTTVRNHLAAIFRKVGVGSQTELLAVLLPDDPLR